MEKVNYKTIICPEFKHLHKEEYNYNDVINFDNTIGTLKKPYVDTLFRPRLNHITYSVDTHPKSNICKSIATKIFFEWVRIMIDELIKGNKVKINHVGVMWLQTREYSTKYRGFKEDKKRTKEMGFYTSISCEFDSRIATRFKYGIPFIVFGKHYKSLIRRLEDNGKKY